MSNFSLWLQNLTLVFGIISVIATAYQAFILTDYDLLAWDDESEDYITYSEYLEL